MLNTLISRKNERILLVGIGIAFVVGMLFWSGFSSPLYPCYFKDDSALFMLIGKGMVHGKTVYADLFDHKGPILFFIEALGFLLGGRIGVWLIQCIAGIVTILFTYGIWKLLQQSQQELKLIHLLSVLVGGYTIFFFTFWNGNFSEEYSLPFIAVSLYGFVKYAMGAEQEAKHPWTQAVVYGISVSALSLIRINNAVSICAGVLVIGIYLIYKKEFKNIFQNIAGGLLGCAIVFVPVILYFCYKGALYEMLYATFLYNFKYASLVGHRSILEQLPRYAILYLPVLISIILMVNKVVKDRKNTKKVALLDAMILVMIGFNFAFLLIANMYVHYFTIYIPLYMLVLSRCLILDRKSWATKLFVVCAGGYFLLSLYSFGATFLRNHITGAEKEVHTTIYNDTQKIPVEEQDSVIGYNISASYYLHGDILPCYKYYTYQDWWSISNPSIKEDFVTFLREDKPLWILTNLEMEDEEVGGILSEAYELQFSNDYIMYYRMKDAIRESR